MMQDFVAVDVLEEEVRWGEWRSLLDISGALVHFDASFNSQLRFFNHVHVERIKVCRVNHVLQKNNSVLVQAF
jgi:hypothetical protein